MPERWAKLSRIADDLCARIGRETIVGMAVNKVLGALRRPKEYQPALENDPPALPGGRPMRWMRLKWACCEQCWTLLCTRAQPIRSITFG